MLIHFELFVRKIIDADVLGGEFLSICYRYFFHAVLHSHHFQAKP